MFYRNIVHPNRLSGSWRSRVRFGSSAPATDGVLLFDVKNTSTMTRPKDVSTKWSKSTVDVTNRSVYGVVTVYDNNFGGKEVLSECETKVKASSPNVRGSWDVHTHCDWCGQSLDYVAVIYGLDTSTNETTVHHIGCDCVGKIFGVKWTGYRNAENARNVLVKAAKVRRRAIEYPQKYAKELSWLDSLPEFLLNKNDFLRDMKKVLRTGERAVSKKMENYLHALMNKREYDPKTFATAKAENDKVEEKLRGILHLIEEIEPEENRPPYSSYNFVKSVLDKFERYHSPLTQKQMEALNRVYVKYRDMRVNKVTKTSQMKGNPNDIPW